jgi:DNA-binding response OmpR family regulator
VLVRELDEIPLCRRAALLAPRDEGYPAKLSYSRIVGASDSGVIVVADDDADILDLVSLTLERAGHIVHRARDGEEALELVRRECPDVAVLDVAMPKLDGFELTRRLRGDPDTSEVRIVLLTARVQEADTDTGLAAGAHEYIPKPFSPQDLQERIAALLRRRSE